ncbi:MAG: hypothetical protein WA618_02940, partial [Terriglobales bacterium]
MKRTAIIVGILSLAVWAAAQSTGSTQQTPPPAGQTPPTQGTAAQGTPAPGAPAQPAVKRPPQAKTQPEYDAYKAAAANTDAAALEKAAADFATKFPDSELRILLYRTDMGLYQAANNAEKTEEIGRKVLAIDPDDPTALTIVSDVIALRTRDTDVDRNQRYDEGMKMAQRSITTVDTDVMVPPGTPQERIDAFKAQTRAQAYSTMGMIEYNRSSFPAAQEDFQKAVDADPGHPYAPDILHLGLAIDRVATLSSDQAQQTKLYTQALDVVNRAVSLT